MRKIDSSINEPIKFFTEFFSNNGFHEFKDDFIMWCYSEKKSHPELVHLFEVDGDFIMHQTISNGLDGTEDLKTTLIDRLEKTFESQAKKSMEFIDESILHYLDEHNDADKFLKFHEKKLTELIESNRMLFEEYPVCITPLNSIVEYIKDSYFDNLRGASSIKKKIPISRTLSKDDEEIIEYSFFAGHNIKRNFLKRLYEKFIDHLIIDELEDYELGEQQFVEIFSSLHPEQSGYKIKFKINNIEIAYIINKLQPYFKNLNPNSIGKSECFIKNNSNDPLKNDLLKRGDIYTARTTMKENLLKQELKIRSDVLALAKELKNI